MGPIMAPTGPDVSCSAQLGQFGDNLAAWRIFTLSNRIRKIVPASFSPGFGLCPNPGLASNFKPREGGPSRLGQVNSPVPGLSAGGLLGAQLSNAGGREGCLLPTPSRS